MHHTVSIADVLNKYIKVESAKLDKNKTKVIVNLIYREIKNARFKAVIKYHALDRGNWHQHIEFITSDNIRIGTIPKSKIERELRSMFNPIMTLSYTRRL